MAKNSCQKVPKSDFQSQFSTSKIIRIFLKKNSLENINLGAHFLFLSILCSMKIERLLFLKFLKFLAFFDSYFWPFNKSHEKTNVIFVISAVMASIWNVFIKFRWHDEKFTIEGVARLFWLGLVHRGFRLSLSLRQWCKYIFSKIQFWDKDKDQDPLPGRLLKAIWKK